MTTQCAYREHEQFVYYSHTAMRIQLARKIWCYVTTAQKCYVHFFDKIWDFKTGW